MGWRPPGSPAFSARRFLLESPRGARAVVVGATTWGVYEGAHLLLKALHDIHSSGLKSFDQAHEEQEP